MIRRNRRVYPTSSARTDVREISRIFPLAAAVDRGSVRQNMKVPSAALLLAIALCGCSREATEQALPYSAEIEFEYNPSFADATRVTLYVTADGRATCAVRYRRLQSDFAEWAYWKDVAITSQDFFALSSAMEDERLRRTAELTPERGMHGTSWRFEKKIASRRLVYSFWTPEQRPEDPSSAPALALAKRFVDLAQIKMPNESEGPTIESRQPR